MKKLKKLLLLAFVLAISVNHLTAQTRLGLHLTQEELLIIRARTPLFDGQDKYVANGDVSTNSYGDWNRIITNKTNFNNNPAADRYDDYYTGPGKFPKLNDVGRDAKQDPTIAGELLRDAAFYCLVSEGAAAVVADRTTVLAKVRTELLWYANNSWFNFANTTRFPPNGFYDLNPGFIMSEWLIRLLYAYDYVKEAPTLTSGDKAILDAWFLQAARYMATNYDISLNGTFRNRIAGDYTFSPTAAKNTGKALMYYGGPESRYVCKLYSNRRATMAAWVLMAGVYFNDASLILSGKRYVKEYIRFGIYPNGTGSDFVRSLMDKSVDKGFGYAINSTLWAAVDALARAGDTSLYDYTTSEGDATPSVVADRTTDGVTLKGLEMHFRKMLDMMNHVGTAYYSSVANPAGNVNLRMDADDALKNTHLVAYLAYLQAARYYAGPSFPDTYFKQSIRRTYTGQGGIYPSSPAKVGASAALSFYGGYPAILLTQMDVDVWPYSATTGKLSQSITFNALPSKTFGDGSFTPVATASSGLAVAWTSSNTGVATVNASSGVVTIVGAGTSIITTSQAGNGSYNAAPDQARTLTVNKASQSITFPAMADRAFSSGKFRLPTSTSTSGGVVTFVVSSGAATISSLDTLNPSAAGPVVVTAYQVGSANYQAAPTVSRTMSFTASAPTGVSDLLIGVAASDTNRYVYDGLGNQQLQSSRWFVLAATHTGYTPKKITIPSGFGQPENTLGITQVWVRNAAGVATLVGTFDATNQPIYEAEINAGTFTFNTLYLRTFGKNMRMRVPAGATGIKFEGF